MRYISNRPYQISSDSIIGNYAPREGQLLPPQIRDSELRLPTQGIATREDIDTTLKLGMNHPMGPLQLGTLPILCCVIWTLTETY